MRRSRQLLLGVLRQLIAMPGEGWRFHAVKRTPLTHVRLCICAHPHNTSVATCEAGTASIRITSPIELSVRSGRIA